MGRALFICIYLWASSESIHASIRVDLYEFMEPYVYLGLCIFSCVYTLIEASFYPSLSLNLSLSPSVYLLHSVFGIHVCLSTDMRYVYPSCVSFCRYLYTCLCLFGCFFLMTSPSFSMVCHLNLTLLHSPLTLPSDLSVLFLSLLLCLFFYVYLIFSMSSSLQCLSLLASLPNNLLLPLSISLFPSHSSFLSTLGSRKAEV